MYVPSIETQRSIPEIPLESKDDLQVISSETIAQIFERNPHIISIEKMKSLYYDYIIKPSNYVNNKGPIGVNIGNIQKKILKPGKITNEKHTISHHNLETENTNSQLNIESLYNKPKHDSTKVTSNVKEYYHQPSSYGNNVPPITNDNTLHNQHIKDQETNSYPGFHVKPNVNLRPDRETDLIHHTNIAENNNNDNYDIYDESQYNEYGYQTFNTWFDEQVKILPELKETGYSDITDIYVLKKQIIKIIEQNGMIIGRDNLVRDLSGSYVDMRNMKLRRIVIEEKFVNNYNDPPLSLDGVMITLVYPPKILGVIPLRRIYFSEEVAQITQPLHEPQIHQSLKPVEPSQLVQSTATKSIQTSVEPSQPLEHTKIVLNEIPDKCAGSVCKKQLPAGGIITEKTKSTTVVDTHTSSQNTNNDDEIAKLLRLQTGRNYNTDLQMRKQSKNDDSPLKYVTNILDTYKFTPLDQLSKLVKNFITPLTNSIGQSTEPKKEAHKKSEEDLGFRIIGGNAATASGAPLNMRGRSGLSDIY
ncbi:uncharacterized protein LOC128200433 [Galleria mellonella]|uniref:Uncharacterized protein LOC128200433 n=1 Tax=Galleria mellonella TaxID=7137 RepID=A0ABM3MEF2_GALME|nr:uncharacterized protein LOC128200433 [Galleria mellonella]